MHLSADLLRQVPPLLQVKVAERAKKLEAIVDEACSGEALKDLSSHGRQLRPLHVLNFSKRDIKRVRHPSFQALGFQSFGAPNFSALVPTLPGCAVR